ncbi:MAG: hypothetical protein ACJ8AD_20170 [Gemmatimonadaceae bacterium]
MLPTEHAVLALEASRAEGLLPRFDAVSLELLLARLNAEPELLDRDWRDLVRAAFQMSPEQAKSLTVVTEARVAEVQEFFREAAVHIRCGGALTGRIIRRPPAEQTPEAVHEVHLELIDGGIPWSAPARSFTPRMLRIAHCDANCRNWQWNSF